MSEYRVVAPELKVPVAHRIEIELPTERNVYDGSDQWVVIDLQSRHVLFDLLDGLFRNEIHVAEWPVRQPGFFKLQATSSASRTSRRFGDFRANAPPGMTVIGIRSSPIITNYGTAFTTNTRKPATDRFAA